MRYLKLLVYLFLSLFTVTSCMQQDVEVFIQKGGSFRITFVDDIIAKTKSLPSEITNEMADNFYLTINKENGTKAFKGSMQKYNEQQPSFAPGTYTIAASLGENQILALDAPYYEATPGEYEIAAGQTTSVTMICTVANALASFAFDNPEVVSSYLKSYEIITKIGDEEVSCMVGDGKNPYFKEGQTVNFILRGTSAQNTPIENTPVENTPVENVPVENNVVPNVVDNTTAPGKLPQTGDTLFYIISVLVIGTVGVLIYNIKNKK